MNFIDPDGKRLLFVVGTKFYEYNNGNFWLTKVNENGNLTRTDIRYNPSKESISKTMYRVLNAYRKIENSKNKQLKGILKTLESSKIDHFIYENNDGYNQVNSTYGENGKLKYTQTNFDLDADGGTDYKDIGSSDLGTVTHEMRHQYDRDIDNMKDNIGAPLCFDEKGTLHVNPSEIRAVYLENEARKLESLKPRTRYSIEIPKKNLNNPPNNKMP